MIAGLGPTEILVIILMFVLIFWSRRIPELTGNLGRGIVEFKKGLSPDDPKTTFSPPPAGEEKA